MKNVYVFSPYEYIETKTDEEALKIAEDKFENNLYHNFFLGELIYDDIFDYDEIKKKRCEEQGLDWEIEKDKKTYLFKKFLVIEAEDVYEVEKKLESMFEPEFVLRTPMNEIYDIPDDTTYYDIIKRAAELFDLDWDRNLNNKNRKENNND